jgi:hypothetical protein
LGEVNNADNHITGGRRDVQEIESVVYFGGADAYNITVIWIRVRRYRGFFSRLARGGWPNEERQFDTLIDVLSGQPIC